MSEQRAPQQFVSKPRFIKAYQITRSLLESILFDDQPYPKGLFGGSSSFHKQNRTISHWLGSVITVHGQDTIVEEGDWIIEEPDGEHYYPCKPDIFADRYQLPEGEWGKANRVGEYQCCKPLIEVSGKSEQSKVELLSEVIFGLKRRRESHIKYIATDEGQVGSNGYAAVLVPDWQVMQWIAAFEAALQESPSDKTY